jgi:hypothetical protein
MAAADATSFVVKNQAYRLYFVMLDNTTGNPITGGLTVLAATRSLDGAAFAATSGTATEIGTTGFGYVDLVAAETNTSATIVHVTASNATALYFNATLFPLDLSESSTHWMKQTVKRLEQGILQMASWFVNKTKRNNSTGTITVRNVADSADVTTLAVNETSGEEVKASWS